MSLPDGDYITIQDHIVTAIEADTGVGGLREPDDPPVKTIESVIRGESQAIRDHELPAISVMIVSMDERLERGGAVRSYRVNFVIRSRGLDVANETQHVQRIAARLEELLREENASGRQLADLPNALSWSVGALELTPSHTEFMTGEDAGKTGGQFWVIGIVTASLEIPAAVY